MAGELKPLVAAAFFWYLFTIAAYSMVGPARDALLMTRFGPAMLPWVYLAGAALTGAAVWTYGRFARSSRRRLIGGTLAALALTLGGGGLLVAEAGSRALSFLYFLWCDVFGIMSVTLFWTYVDDVFTAEESLRVFGLLSAAAPVGAILGDLAVRRWVRAVGPSAILVAAAALFALAVPLFFLMESRAGARGKAGAPPRAAAPVPPAGLLKTIGASPFLLWLAALVAFERLVPDFSKYLYSVESARAFGGDARAMASFFAGVDLWTGVGSFVAGILLTAPALRLFGIGGLLASAGLANLALLALYPAAPGLRLCAVFMALEGTARYTWFKTAKESTYTATGKDVLYRVKAFIEMFVYRIARGVAGILLLAAGWAGMGARGVAVLAIPFGLAWLYAAARTAREHARVSEGS